MYSWKNVVLKGFALFAMLFGAGNLIFPPMLGKTLADSWAIGTMGFILTGVGFPLLGILSTSLSGKKDIEEFANKVSPWFAKLFFPHPWALPAGLLTVLLDLGAVRRGYSD